MSIPVLVPENNTEIGQLFAGKKIAAKAEHIGVDEHEWSKKPKNKKECTFLDRNKVNTCLPGAQICCL